MGSHRESNRESFLVNKNTGSVEANAVPAGGSEKDDAENEGDSDDDRDDEQAGGSAEVNGSF